MLYEPVGVSHVDGSVEDVGGRSILSACNSFFSGSIGVSRSSPEACTFTGAACRFWSRTLQLEVLSVQATASIHHQPLCFGHSHISRSLKVKREGDLQHPLDPGGLCLCSRHRIDFGTVQAAHHALHPG